MMDDSTYATIAVNKFNMETLTLDKLLATMRKFERPVNPFDYVVAAFATPDILKQW